ncbi:MAG: hypothetical protein ACLRI8_12675 [Agathobacter rectalis]
MASDGDNIIGLWLEGQKYYGGTLTEKCFTRENIPVFYPLKLGWIILAGERPLIENLPLLPKGENFDRMWKLMSDSVRRGGDLWGYCKKMAVVTGKRRCLHRQSAVLWS